MARTAASATDSTAACCSGREAPAAAQWSLFDCRRGGEGSAAAAMPTPARRGAGRARLALRASLALALALRSPGASHAQTDFTDAPAGDYLTFCMEAATGFLPTGACADASYDTLQRYLATALTDPFAFAEHNETTIAGVTALCDAGCDAQLLTLAQKYVAAMPSSGAGGAAPADNSWCAAVTGPNTSPLLANAIPFLCTRNDAVSDADSYCVVQVGKALYEANVLSQLVEVLEGGAAFDASKVDTTELCREMFETGCCAQTFLDVAQSMLLMTCHPDTASALQTLFQGCSPGLKPGCEYSFAPFEMPANCPEGGLVLPRVGTTCPIPTGSCPITQCEFLCAIVAADPPGNDNAMELFSGKSGMSGQSGSGSGSLISTSDDAAAALGDSSGDGEAPGEGALASRGATRALSPARPRERSALDAWAWVGALGVAAVAAQAAARGRMRGGVTAMAARDPSGTELATRWPTAGSRGEFSWPPRPESRG